MLHKKSDKNASQSQNRMAKIYDTGCKIQQIINISQYMAAKWLYFCMTLIKIFCLFSFIKTFPKSMRFILKIIRKPVVKVQYSLGKILNHIYCTSVSKKMHYNFCCSFLIFFCIHGCRSTLTM